MKIYLDYIFLENLVVNILITINIYKFTKNKLKIARVIIGAIFLAIYTTLTYILNDSFLVSMNIKGIAVIIYVYISFKPKTIIQVFKYLVYYLLFSFLYVGVIISVSILFKVNLENFAFKIATYLISEVVLIFFTNYLWKMWKSNIKNNDLTYKLNIDGQEITGFVDTGNSVKDILTGLDVLFIDDKYEENIKRKLEEKKEVKIYTDTVNGGVQRKGYVIENIEVYKEKTLVGKIKKVVICFVKLNISQKEYSALIGYNTYIENLKGVKFC